MSELNQERLSELKGKLAEILKTKTDKQVQMLMDGRIREINYTVLGEEIKDALYALESAILEDDEKIRIVFKETTSRSVYNAIYKYFHGVEPKDPVIDPNAPGILSMKKSQSGTP